MKVHHIGQSSETCGASGGGKEEYAIQSRNARCTGGYGEALGLDYSMREDLCKVLDIYWGRVCVGSGGLVDFLSRTWLWSTAIGMGWD